MSKSQFQRFSNVGTNVFNVTALALKINSRRPVSHPVWGWQWFSFRSTQTKVL